MVGAGLRLRQGEALGLAVEDIDFDKEVVHVRRQVKMARAKLCFALRKGRKVRDVPLPPSVARAVREHMSGSLLCRSRCRGTTPLLPSHRWRRSIGGRGRTTSW
ncbi:site-specific integrase [Streptomyces kanasensis]|uniref:hypothetical protein n=1 Tax=Streptomyces kanasensis TaxID=936756 RepID=UPI0037F82C1B